VAHEAPLLDVQSLHVCHRSGAAGSAGFRLLADVSLSLRASERVAVIGASGAGKSMLALALMGLLREPLAVCGGRMLWRGRDLLTLTAAERHALRGRELFLVFQSPGSLLDPLLTIGRQLAQTARRAGAKVASVASQVDAALRRVGFDGAVQQLHAHQLSGGMKQRVLLARALYKRPKILVLDEATSHLDVFNERRVNQAIAGLKLTRIVVAHRPETIESAGRVIALGVGEDGATVEPEPAIQPGYA